MPILVVEETMEGLGGKEDGHGLMRGKTMKILIVPKTKHSLFRQGMVSGLIFNNENQITWKSVFFFFFFFLLFEIDGISRLEGGEIKKISI